MPSSSTSPQIVTPAKPLPSSQSGLAVTLRQSSGRTLHAYYQALFMTYGPQHWWPGRSRFEIVVGAILTQNTSWKNVERAIGNLRNARLLSPFAIHTVPAATLARHLRPSGYFRQKTKTLKSFVDFLYGNYAGSLARLFAVPTSELRERLLALRGIGPETVDSILLYAGGHPVFVVDAYARRILDRHALIPAAPGSTSRSPSRKTYEAVRSFFESQLPRDPQLFNEFHALIVHTGKHFCRKAVPDCRSCPLAAFLPTAGSSQVTSHESPVTTP